MPRRVLDLQREVDDGVRDPVLGRLRRRRDRSPPVDPLRPRVLLAGRVAERLGHVAHRRLGAVRDDVGDLRRVVAAVLAVDVLDDLLAPVALDVDVDVRRPVALGRQEALEQQAERHGVGGGDAEGVADGRVGGAAPALAEDVLLPAEPHEVPHDEEVAGEAELLDDRQLVVDRAPRPGPQRRRARRRAGRCAVAVPGAVLDDAAQVGHLAQPVGARERRQRRGDERQVEGGGPPDLGGQLDDARVAGEAAALLGTRAEVGAGRGRQPRVELGQAAPRPHGGERRGQAALRRRGVVGVRRGDAADVVAGGELGEGVVARRVERVAVVPQLDEHAVAPERLDQPLQLAPGGRRAVGERAPAAPLPCGSRSAPTRRRRCCGRRRRA